MALIKKTMTAKMANPSSTSMLLIAASTISVAEVPATSYPMPAQHCRGTVWQCLLNHLGGRVNRRSPSGGYQETMRFTSIEYRAGYPPVASMQGG